MDSKVRPTVVLDMEDYQEMKNKADRFVESATKYSLFCEYYRIKIFETSDADIFLSTHGYRVDIRENKIELIKLINQNIK